MGNIHKLDKSTIDLIAAGEVIERPRSVVKELVENAVDAGATAITVEIREGGTGLIRVTDNGCGIAAEDVRIAFESHATSKIEEIGDLFALSTLGFRGEALSSIAAVSKTDLVTRTGDSVSGIRISIHGGEETGFEEIGAPVGTTVVVRDLFFNTPARRKFLKAARTESSYVGELMERLALAYPDVAFQFIRDKKDALVTNGLGDYKDLIHRIFGRETASRAHPFFAEQDGYSVAGYLGEPSLNRAKRSHEMFFVNGRYVRDKLLSHALEEGCSEYLMQHRFPFAILMLKLPPDTVDVNAHPSKLEVRFHEPQVLSEFVASAVRNAMRSREMIPSETQAAEARFADSRGAEAARVPEPFEAARRQEATAIPEAVRAYTESAVWKHIFTEDGELQVEEETEKPPVPSPIIKRDAQVFVERDVQMDMFDVKMLTKEHRAEYRILGQVFGTYWVLVFRDRMFIVDQHAAHEKVNYERMMARYRAKDMMSQLLNPPLIVTLTAQEEALFRQYEAYFRELGFQVEAFGAHAYAMRAVPAECYGAGEQELFLSILDELSEDRSIAGDPSLIAQRIATMSCKASVKGNTEMTLPEMEALLDEMLTLENPYNCPHGRPTIISMSRYEIDKKFKRIV
ncbi:MAG: DNA mismatch repair endonuclease MutL [Lachnospiraceae bacterium]|nr:DNA mismatch repair endonuclease MutL [Lachnospiraceae bacterium]